MLRIIPLGGLGEIGLNMLLLEHEKHVLIVDAGLMFPDDFLPGVDLVIPDFSYLREKRDNLRAVILTHGHEDHIGAMPFLLREFALPVYATGFTLDLLREKLMEHQLLEQARLHQVHPGDVSRFGPFSVEFIAVNHSIVDGVGLALETPEGVVIHSGDFRIDSTPVDRQFTDLVRFAYYGARGVLAFFSDSTNAEKDGLTLSEMEVRKTLAELFQSCSGRIIVATFASNITRIQQVIELASQCGRKVVLNGKSMITNVGLARQRGFIHIPEGLEIRESQIGQLPDHTVTVITTGSQGEPMSALARMAQGRHKGIQIKPGDTIILSSRFIPGNERAITAIINSLYRLGAEVVYEKVSDIHTSGHARREELKLMLSLVRPRYFVPIHGEYRHLVKHGQIAADMGLPEDRILVAENGMVLTCEHGEIRMDGRVPTGRVLVDGKGVGDVGETILQERRKLSGHGLVIVLLVVDEQRGHLLYGPDMVSRGFVFEEEWGYVLEDAKELVLEILEEAREVGDWERIKTEIQRRLKKFFYRVLDRGPLILPIVVQV